MIEFEKIWIEQCTAARGIRARHGVAAALDYLIRDKLVSFAEAAVTRPEFARELPRFVAEIRNIFDRDDIRRCFDHLERMAAIEEEAPLDEEDDDLFAAPRPGERAASRARLAQLKELLTSTALGTG